MAYHSMLLYLNRVARIPRTSSTDGLQAQSLRARGLRGSGSLEQAARYVLTGGTVAAVYLGTTTALADAVGLPFQIALAIGACAGVMIHFTLQRFFVWAHSDGFALAPRHQAARYLVLVGAQYGLTAASTAFLPAALGLPVELVYFGTVAILVSLNFLLLRNAIFHPKASVQP